ncbi:hypothetical protein OH492_14165 [Vibrio chagasii]|nr:hypothetical protein [Vibrio chagasii]
METRSPGIPVADRETALAEKARNARVGDLAKSNVDGMIIVTGVLPPGYIA